jgi:4-hydroxy-3-polyprenylbenzoate decarboxylase
LEACNSYAEIREVNSSLLDIGVPLVFVSVEKNRKGHVKELAGKLLEMDAFRLVKVLIFLEHTMDIADVADAVWRFSNNFDPKRDHFNFPCR